jgi:hypothetical protein
VIEAKYLCRTEVEVAARLSDDHGRGGMAQSCGSLKASPSNTVNGARRSLSFNLSGTASGQSLMSPSEPSRWPRARRLSEKLNHPQACSLRAACVILGHRRHRVPGRRRLRAFDPLPPDNTGEGSVDPAISLLQQGPFDRATVHLLCRVLEEGWAQIHTSYTGRPCPECRAPQRCGRHPGVCYGRPAGPGSLEAVCG